MNLFEYYEFYLICIQLCVGVYTYIRMSVITPNTRESGLVLEHVATRCQQSLSSGPFAAPTLKSTRLTVYYTHRGYPHACAVYCFTHVYILATRV